MQKLIGAKSKSTVWAYVEKGILPKPRYQQPHRYLQAKLLYQHVQAEQIGVKGSHAVAS